MVLVYSKWASPLLDSINADIANTSTLASSLLTSIVYGADLFGNEAMFLTGNFGFDGYMGVPRLMGANAKQAAAQFNVAWQSIDPALNPSLRALTSAASLVGASGTYATRLLLADTMPLVFSFPVLPSSLDADGSDFEVTLSDGTTVTPQIAGLLPNLEYNERQTVVIDGDFGNRITPGSPGARYPISVAIVNDGTPLQMIGRSGPVSAVGLSIDSSNSYVAGNGPRLVSAKLNLYSDLGEGGPVGVGAASQHNSGSDSYGDQAQYRLRLYTSAGFSPDGIASLMPDDFSRFFQLKATTESGENITITETGVSYAIGNQGTISVVGLADLAPAGTPLNAAYVEDHDNYYDVILEGDLNAIKALSAVRMPSGNGYSAVYNPGGPGNSPDAPAAALGPFTVPSQDHSIPISFDLDGSKQVTFVETDGAVLRNPWNLQPVGRLLGTAVEDTVTGQTILAYIDPQERRFFSSFIASSSNASDLANGRSELSDIDLIDTRDADAASGVVVTGSFSRSAEDDSILQWYSVSDAEGTLVDPLSGSILKPSEPGYAEAASRRADLINNNTLELINSVITPFRITLESGSIYAPLITNQTSGEQYFAFAEANADGLEHYTGFGTNSWGLEDIFGGGDRDYDDMIVRFSLSS
ncbi:DUF4114 domain-containing protein [Synechococcus sp. UW179A]|uniref:DUF4114 domain-containing protein n=1 Tax=Synechococcus sp. UW179A TaxID=2575510 RepID=UPI000E0FDF2B|nr:DUF4114 domain-containing protein [Synechococcus sp. UW179A]